MHFGILAAGEGSRLKADGILSPKPLVNLGQELMIDRLVRIFMNNGATSLSIIVNEEMKELQNFWDKRDFQIPFQLITKSTKGSFESFSCLCSTILSYPFCFTTVDTIFDETEFAEYIKFLKTTTSSGLFAVTDYIDDESPLYIRTDLNQNIVKIFERGDNELVRYISGGIYGFTKDISYFVNMGIQKHISKMRDFQKLLIDGGLDVKVFPMKNIFDVDRKSDLIKVNTFIAK